MKVNKMPVFRYTGYDLRGKSIKGFKEADSVKNAKNLLQRENVFIISIWCSPIKSKSNFEFLYKININDLISRVNINDIGFMTRQLSALLIASIPMAESFSALIEQVETRSFKNILLKIKSDINEGLSLGDAVSKYSIFSSVYVNMVKMGETSGSLEIVLERLAAFIEGQIALRSKVKSAMLYPLIMLIVASCILIVMLTTIVPNITRIFKHSKMQLPIMTKVLIFISNFLVHYWWIMFILLILLFYFFVRWKKSHNGRKRWHNIILKIPIFGNIIQMIIVSRFSRTLSILMNSGVPLLNSLQIARDVVSNAKIEEIIDSVKISVREGENIASILKESGQFSAIATYMIAIGEKSGQLENMLEKLADNYEEQVKNQLSMITILLEPFMIIFMGGVIGFIIFSILMPLLQMSSIVK